MGTLDARYSINGVISTDKTVLQNLETLAGAAGSWISYDIHDGKWSVVINQAGSSIFSFNDSNIIGSIAVGGTGLTDLYNSVNVQFPHIDLNDELDYVSVTIPAEDRNANEPDNQLQIQYDILNDPVQAELLGLIELKQSRVDKTIRFTTDFSALGLKAGDLIDITSSIYGFTNKVFRIIEISESDSEEGNIYLDITALEYDANVYSNDDITRYARSNSTGIVTIGAIGIPGTPTVNKFESNARPRIVAESTSPTGIVEAMEFWLTTDVPPAVTDDANRSYSLLRTVYPVTGNTFAFGETVTLDYDNLNASNFLIKTRGINKDTSGPFSTPTGTVFYAPVQTTNAVDANTIVSDGAGGNLLSALALTTLLGNLDKLFNSNVSIASGVGGVFDKIFKVFDEKTGVDLVTQANTINTTTLAGTQTVTSLPSVTDNTEFLSLGFSPVNTGTYKVDVICDVSGSGCRGGRGSAFSEVIDEQYFRANITNSGGTVIGYADSGGIGAFGWNDYYLTTTVNLTGNVTYNLDVDYYYDPGSNPSQTMSVVVGYNITRIA